jgi:hypothetical protein
MEFIIALIIINSMIWRHSRNAPERESKLFLRNTGSPTKAFGDDEKLPLNALPDQKRKLKRSHHERLE